MTSEKIRLERQSLTNFCKDVFQKLGCNEKEAEASAKILVAADARGIESHGTARLKRYVNGIKSNVMFPNVKPKITRETPISKVVDAKGAMGMYLSKNLMDETIAKAKKTGAAFACAKDSNHFGIAGYYSEMAAKEGLIGIAMTNTAALGVPTYGRKAMFGTNPIAFSVPASKNRMFTLDMATTCVTRGKLEVYARNGQPIPQGWAVNTKGLDSDDAPKLLEDMIYQRGGGMLPLGGSSQLLSGYKGYGLAVMVDILTALLSGGTFGKHVFDSALTSARVCHFFAVVQIELFRDSKEFLKDMGTMLDDLNNTDPAEGCQKVYYAGEIEHQNEKISNEQGVPIAKNVVNALKIIGKEMKIDFPKMERK